MKKRKLKIRKQKTGVSFNKIDDTPVSCILFSETASFMQIPEADTSIK